MFDQFDPAEDKMLQVIDNSGKVIGKEWMPQLTDEEMVKLYKDMLFVRTLDFMIVSYQRQGRLYTYPPNFGQEAISVAAGAVMRHDDWLVPAFRELGAYLAKGMSMKEIFMFNMVLKRARLRDKHMLPMSVPIASTAPRGRYSHAANT
jgi:pyruvate dehydrogenase E1 component alpha subunit